MALLDNILKKIKAATLDRTTLDEKIGGFASNAIKNISGAFGPKEPIHSPIPIQPIVRPTATPRQPIIKPVTPSYAPVNRTSALKKLSDVMGNVTAAPYNAVKTAVKDAPTLAKSVWDNLSSRKFGENVGKAIVRPVDYVNENRMAKSDLSEADKMTNIALRLQKAGRVKEAQTFFQRSRDLSQGVVGRATKFKEQNKKLQKDIVDTGIKTGLSLGGAGYTAANPGLIAGGALIPAVIAKITGQDVAKAAGKGIAESLPYSGVMQFTTPGANILGGEITKRFGKYFANPIFKSVMERGLVGAGNVAENRIINKVTSQDNSAEADIFAFALGAMLHKPGKTIQGWAELPDATRTSIIRMANAAGLDTSPVTWAGDIKWNGTPKFLDDVRFSLKKDGLMKTLSENANVGLSTKPKGGTKALMAAESTKNDQFYIKKYNQTGSKIEFSPVKGRKVEIIPGIDTFIHKNPQGEWVVSDRRTGLAMSRGQSTQKGAIEDFKSVISSVEKAGKPVQQHIDEAATKFGETPNYSQSNAKIHAMPSGEVMAGPEHAGAVPGSTTKAPKTIVPTDQDLAMKALERSRGYGPSAGGRVPTNEEVAMNALNKSRNLSDVMATKPTETKLPLPQTEPPTKISEVLQTGQQPTTPVQTQSTGQKPNIMTGQNRSSDNIIAEARKEIGRASEDKKPLSKAVNDLYTQWVDRYNPITKVSEFTKKILKGKGAILRPEADPAVLVRKLTGAGGIADARFNSELKPIIDEADKLKIDKADLDVFLKAKRDVGFGSVGRDIKGSDPVMGQQRIDALRSKYGDSIDQIANKLYEYQNKGFQEMVDAGFLSKESADLIRQQNPDYVPFNRVMEEVDNYLGLPTRKTMQGTNPVKKIEGSDRMVESPIESIIGNTFKQRAAIEKNNVAKSIVNLQTMAPDLGFEKVATTGNDTITVWNNGQKEYWRVGTDIADTAKGLNEENMNGLLKIFRAPASLLRQGATGRNPEFMIPNIVRDQLDAGITSKYGYIPFVDYLSGLKSMLTNDEVYQKWERSGAKIDLGEMSGKKSIQQFFDEKGARKGLFSWLSAGLDVMGKYSEQPTRVGLFKKAYKATGNELLAMMESRDATVDFARMGSKMKVANSIIPFLNVGVQGFDKLIRSVADHPGKVLTNGLIYGALPAISTTAYNLMYHPEEYAEVPQYEKDSNFILVRGRNEKGTVDYVTIPKGNILPLISNPIESFMAYAAGESQQNLGEFAAQFISSALPVVGEGQSLKEIMTKTIGSNLPQLIKPAAESLVNKSFYKYDPKKEQSKEIVPSYLQKREPYLQSYEWTPEMYKKIGAVFNTSPLQVQNLMEGYLAGYAKIPAQIVEGMKNISEGNDVPTNEKTIIRRFIKETYPSSGKPAEPKTTTPFMERVTGKVSAAERGGGQVGGEKPSETKIANEKYLLQSSKSTTKDLGGGVYLIKKDNGDVEKVDMSEELVEPKLTGNTLLDKKLTSKYKGKITSRQNDIVDLYSAGLIDEKKAESMLTELAAISDKVSGESANASAKLLKALFKAAQDDIKDRASLREFLRRKPTGITSTLKKISELTGMKKSSSNGEKSIREILNKRRNQEPLYPGPK